MLVFYCTVVLHLVSEQNGYPPVKSTTKSIKLLNLFKKDPKKKLEKEYRALMLKARDVQRSGDIIAYSGIVAQSEEILERIKTLEDKSA